MMKTKNITLLLLLLSASLLANTSLRAEILVIVHPSNDISELRPTEVIDIFMGRYNTFKNGVKAVPLDQSELSGIRDRFYVRLTGRTISQINAYWARLIFTGRTKPPAIAEGDLSIISMVKNNQNAIAYIDSQNINSGVKIVLRLK